MQRASMLEKLATMLIFFMIFSCRTIISTETINIKCMGMKKIVNSKSKFQFLHVNNLEIILKFLNFDDLPQILRACTKSKSNYLRQNILQLFETFYENKIQTSIEFLRFEMFHAKQQPKKNSTTLFEKIFPLKIISLPKFVEHAIQTPKFRIVSHIDGFFSIEEKAKNQKQYSVVSIQYLFSEYCGDLDSTDISFTKLLNLIFSCKQFIASILHHENYIFMIFQAGEISFCGKTGEIRMCHQLRDLKAISHFVSRDKTYFMSYFEKSNDFVVYHIPSEELFLFKNSSLKAIFLNSNSKLDYDFLKNNGKFFGFVKPNEFLFMQMMPGLGDITEETFSKALNPNRVDKMLNEIEKN